MIGGVVTVSAVTFHDWVRSTAGHDSYETIAAKIGTTGNTVRSWKSTAPAARFVIAFARVYGVPIPEAFMQAYGLTADELGVTVSPDPRRLSNDELVSEVARRIKGDGAQPEPASEPQAGRSRRLKDEQRKRKVRQQGRAEGPDLRRRG